MAPQQFAADSQFGPQYAQLYQDILNQSLFGQGGQGGLLSTYQQATPQLGNIQSSANTQQRLADIGDVEKYGGRAVSAFNQANPQLAALRERMFSQSGSGGGASMINPVLNNFVSSPYDRVTSGPNASTAAYNQRALADLSLGGSLGQQESRDLTNDVLARFNRAGRANDPTAIANVALGLDQAQQARLAQRQAAVATGAGLTDQGNQMGLQAALANQGAGLQLQGYGLQSSLANQSAGQQASLANQQAQLANAQLEQQRMMQAAQFLQGSQIDPFQAILGRSGSLGNAMGAAQAGGATAGYTGSGMFNPFSSYSSDLYNTNYNAQAAAGASSANNRAGIIGGGLGALGSLGAAKIFMACVPEGELVDTPNGKLPIENIHAGDMVVGFDGSPTTVTQKHEYDENPEANRFHRLSFDSGSSLAVCDFHRILNVPAHMWREGDSIGVNTITKIQIFGGVRRSYDLMTKEGGYRMSGIPVNSMIEELVSLSKELA